MNLYFINENSPQKINDFYIDNKVKSILLDYIKLDTVNILFFGNSATGKTCLINTILNEYYENQKYNENVLFLQNIKDIGIHNIRSQLKTFCQSSPNSKSKKTVIFDDVDLIPEQTQQLLRHCINKYSYKINFIGSCSNIQKVIDSIQSNLNIIKLYPLKNDEILDVLNNILSKQKINMNDEVKELIIRMSNHSVRNLLNFVYKIKLSSYTNITTELIIKLCPNISYYQFLEFLEHCFNRDIQSSLGVLENIITLGYSPMDIYENFFNYIKIDSNLSSQHKFSILKLLSKYINIFYSFHEDKQELGFFAKELIEIINT